MLETIRITDAGSSSPLRWHLVAAVNRLLRSAALQDPSRSSTCHAFPPYRGHSSQAPRTSVSCPSTDLGQAVSLANRWSLTCKSATSLRARRRPSLVPRQPPSLPACSPDHPPITRDQRPKHRDRVRGHWSQRLHTFARQRNDTRGYAQVHQLQERPTRKADIRARLQWGSMNR